MKHHSSYFYNVLLEHHVLHQAWCETQKLVKYRENTLTVTKRSRRDLSQEVGKTFCTEIGT